MAQIHSPARITKEKAIIHDRIRCLSTLPIPSLYRAATASRTRFIRTDSLDWVTTYIHRERTRNRTSSLIQMDSLRIRMVSIRILHRMAGGSRVYRKPRHWRVLPLISR